MRKVHMICRDCGSTLVETSSVTAEWNVNTQSYHYEHNFGDSDWCSSCGDETVIEEVEYDKDIWSAQFLEGDVVALRPDFREYDYLTGNTNRDATVVTGIVIGDEATETRDAEIVSLRMVNGHRLNTWPRHIELVRAAK